MKKLIVAVTLAMAFGAASAQELSDGIKQFESRNYTQALQTFQKLAAGGNAEAQFRLGEMYWYGEGTAVDMAKAKALLEQASAQGNGKAQATLNLMAQREVRRDDIAFYTTRYDGGELKTARDACVRPAIPAESKTADDITAMSGAVQKWNDCYKHFGSLLSGATLARTVPADVLSLMNDSEIVAATARMNKVNSDMASQLHAVAVDVIMQNNAWVAATAPQVAAINARNKADIEILLNAQRQARDNRLANDRGPQMAPKQSVTAQR
ncbi:MAG TPA: sel1 repeat family protein [Burkholderiaceae bacterium]